MMNDNKATQVQYPWRTTFRTVMWLVLALLLSAPVIWPIIQEEATKAGYDLPQGVAWVVGILIVAVTVVQRVVLLPPVAAAIAKIPGFSPVPHHKAPDPSSAQVTTDSPPTPITYESDAPVHVKPVSDDRVPGEGRDSSTLL